MKTDWVDTGVNAFGGVFLITWGLVGFTIPSSHAGIGLLLKMMAAGGCFVGLALLLSAIREVRRFLRGLNA